MVITLGDYRDKVPYKKKETGSLEEMIQDFKDWKQAIRNFYLPDMDLKQKRPVYWERLTREVRLTECDIKRIKNEFYSVSKQKFEEELNTEDYELD
jgi:hypothetical protein